LQFREIPGRRNGPAAVGRERWDGKEQHHTGAEQKMDHDTSSAYFEMAAYLGRLE
jgi:hypothetical protein